MTDHNRKRYRIVHDGITEQADLTEAEVEQVKRQFHGFVLVTELLPLDFDAIAQELHEEAKNA